MTVSPNQALSALREIARALSSAWDLDSTLALIAKKTTEVMAVDSCSIYLLDPNSDVLRLRASTGLAKRAFGRSILKVGEGITGMAVKKSDAIYASDVRQSPYFKPLDETNEATYLSLLAIPLVAEAEPIGALNVQTTATHTYDPNQIETLSLIGDMAAHALIKAQLYDKQRQQIDELQALARVSEAVTSPQYLDDILHVVTEMAAKTMNAAVCSLFLLDETGLRLELRSAMRAGTPYQHRDPLAIGEGVIGQVALTGKPIFILDVTTDDRYLGKALAREEGLVSLLAVPLVVRERVIGVLSCYTNVARTFTEEQQALFLTLSNQTALAIENARLVMNAAVIREMHHRIKNNLQTVAMLMQLQMAEADKLDTGKVLEMNIQRIRSIAEVHEVLSHRGFRLVDVKDVLVRITRSGLQMMTLPNQTIEINVYGDTLLLPSRPATALTLVVNELVQNALEHAFVGRSKGVVEVSLGRSPTEIIIIIKDNGIGIPENHESGLGLEIVEALVTGDLNGRLKFNPIPHGTEISLRMPRTLESDIA